MQNSIKRARVLSLQIVSLNIEISLRSPSEGRPADRLEAVHSREQLERDLLREREAAYSRLLLRG